MLAVQAACKNPGKYWVEGGFREVFFHRIF